MGMPSPLHASHLTLSKTQRYAMYDFPSLSLKLFPLHQIRHFLFDNVASKYTLQLPMTFHTLKESQTNKIADRLSIVE